MCCPQAVYDHLPRQRQLSEDVKKEAEGLLRMKVNKKLLQQHLSHTSGKVVTLKDITNIQTGFSKPDENNLESVVSTLRKIEGNDYDNNMCSYYSEHLQCHTAKE